MDEGSINLANMGHRLVEKPRFVDQVQWKLERVSVRHRAKGGGEAHEAYVGMRSTCSDCTAFVVAGRGHAGGRPGVEEPTVVGPRARID
jgi:hypothetical protein